jgi:hypothetical protein
VSEGDHDLQRRLQRLEALLHEIERGPESPARARAREIVRVVLDLHGEALTRIAELAREHGGAAMLEAFVRDPAIAGALLLHKLHPVPVELRVRGAVEALTPMLTAQGGHVLALEVAGAAVCVSIGRESGAGGLPAATLRARVEDAILAAAPEVTSIDVEFPVDIAGFVPVGEVRLRSRRATARPA